MLSITTYFLLAVLILNTVIIVYDYYYHRHHFVSALISPATSTSTKKSFNQQGALISDPHLKAEVVFKGTKFPSTMAFLGPNDILLLQKDNGTVDRIINGTLSSRPPLHVNVATEAERGMLGIAVMKFKNNSNTRPTTYVFLYYTQSGGGKTGDDITSGIEPLGNRLYRYELINDKLVNPKLLLNIPAVPGPFHNGGKIVIGPDDNVYVVIGDLFGNGTKIQNLKNGTDPDGRAGILRVTQDGKPVKGILGDKFPLNLYYAYGIRNSFGMDFDPITKKLWDTENGPDYGDEINLIDPGFNSGWAQVQGIWKPNGDSQGPIAQHPESNLVNFGGKGKYRPPEFIWFQTVAPTALKFFNSTKLGKQYENDMFVGDFNNGILYHFKLNKQRNGLVLNGSLADKISSYEYLSSCDYYFKCIVNSTTGWKNDTRSFQVSTTSTNNGTWSWIYGKEIAVNSGERYKLVSHMKLNEFARGSHIKLEGYNETSKGWDVELKPQCPSGTNGPLQWRGFSCAITIPANTSKIRPVLNAGWSSQPGKEAVTLFDALFLNKEITSCVNKTCINKTIDSTNSLILNSDPIQEIIFGRRFGHITDIQTGPDGYLYILSVQTQGIYYPNQDFPYTDAMKETIYRIVPAKG